MIGRAMSCEWLCSSVAPAGAAVVLENKDVSESRVFLQIDHAIAIGPQHILDPLRRHVGQAICVVRGLDDDFMCADPIHAIVEAEALAVEVAFDLERRELIRHDTHGPVLAVGLHRLWPVGHDFFRRQSLLSWAKWAEGCGQRSGALQGNEIVRPSVPFRRNNHPPTDNRITA